MELYGESNCGTTKFTINGTSRAETGQPNNSETWRTNEWGTGTYNVCFLARGNGGWENADSRCQTVTVSSGQTSSPQSTPYTGSGSGTGTNTGTSGGSGIRNVDNGDDSSDYACDAYLPVEIGSRARLTAGLANRLRSQPTTQSAVLQSVPALTEFNVLSGPYCSGGHVWIEILLDSGDSGFTVAVSDSGENWVEPISNAGESHPNTIYVVEDSFDIYEGDALVLEADVSVTFDTFSNVVRIRTASINYSQGQTNLVNLVCLSRASIFIYDEDMELVHEERGPQRIQPLSLTTVSSEFAIAPFLRGDGTMYVEFWVMGQCVSDRTLFDLATRDPESALDRFEQRQDYNPSVDSITLTVRP